VKKYDRLFLLSCCNVVEPKAGFNVSHAMCNKNLPIIRFHCIIISWYFFESDPGPCAKLPGSYNLAARRDYSHSQSTLKCLDPDSFVQ